MNTTPARPAERHVPGIDGLRAIAVLSVMLYHAQARMLPGGFIGVDVFFVISGYVVSASLARDRIDSFRAFVVNFYARRLVRIYPALLVCLVGSFLLSTLFMPASWLSGTSWKTGFLAFFGLSNMALVWFSDSYFSPRLEFNAFVHTWSLGVEEQFYLLYPILLFTWLRWRQTRTRVAGLIVWVPALAALAYCAWASRAQPEHAFYLLPSRFWELAAGGLLFQWHAGGRGIPAGRGAQQSLLWLGLATIAAGFALADSRAFPFPWAVVPVLGTLLCICAAVAASRSSQERADILSWRGLVYVGKISFSLYLWHWPVFVLFRWTVGLEGLHAAAAAVLTFLLAMASYHWVEVPLRRKAPRNPGNGAGFIFKSVVGIAVLSCVGVSLYVARPFLSLSTVTRHPDVWYPVPTAGNASAATAPAPRWPGRKLFVVGDSHVPAYAVLLNNLQHDTAVTVRTFWEGGCSAAPLLQPSSAGCVRFLNDAITQVERQSHAGDVVFLPGLRVPRLSDQWTAFDEHGVLAAQRQQAAVIARAAALAEADALLARLESSGVVILFELPKPVFAAPPFRCADWFNKGHPICAGGFQISRARLAALAAPTLSAVDALRSRHASLRTWDPLPVLCPQSVCTAFDAAGQPLFFDGDHLSAHGNLMLRSSFEGALAGAFGQRP